MTSLDTGSTPNLTRVAAENLIVNEAVGQALDRDLERFTAVLGQPVTAVRRAALAGHLRFLLDQLTSHHLLLDGGIWPAAVAFQPDLFDLAEQAALSHSELAAPVELVRGAVGKWSNSVDTRLAVHSAVLELVLALEPVLDQDAALLPLACAAIGTAAMVPSTAQPARPTRTTPSTPWMGLPKAPAPTKAARRMFWLLDELDPGQAALLLQRTSWASMWVLRNGFSGAYNRSAYLMWVGGGTGPAV